ncbi:MAG: hypothetical protein ACH255_20820 [Candidatus Thiodiazotropha sp.]
MVNSLTEELIKAGEALLKEADASNFKIDAALWFYFADQEAWKLLLHIKEVEKEGPKHIYNRLQKLLVKAKIKEDLPLSEIALSKPKAPLLNLLKIAVRTGPGISGIRFTGNVINGQLIPDAYIYRLT